MGYAGTSKPACGGLRENADYGSHGVLISSLSPMVYTRWGRNKKQADERLSSDLYELKMQQLR